MNEKLRRDSLITIIGLSVVVAIFTFVVYLPGLKQKQKLNKEIAKIQQEIREIPDRVKQLEQLHQELNQRLAFIDRHQHRIPTVKDTHQVLQRVALLAKTSSLTVSELNPGEFVLNETYIRQPFLLSISGPYSGVIDFLNGLDHEERLFTVSDITLIKQDEELEGFVKGTIELSVCALRGNQRDFSDFDENRVSNAFLAADKR
ncbi:MAG: type 4a pilus biogenesis protein PilO [Planctomycetes bacterium]|nr:type 4a pilus biogenesis protein PilO [Planctomycetota bacterium]MCH9725726.1 type 4a pilus biogenesis protein PilO [Planctomycetota bacterium]MCH9777781.1 type 4a pilus biogenesis protein PilO [Planctomycetota bacterium]MCH9792796.1 type 4a pilus biogenesis protein PilO [Planctomycetota bacterium]MDF1745087.1 type 4a pilus biogenesis protein PilO [Gimesia sp.]